MSRNTGFFSSVLLLAALSSLVLPVGFAAAQQGTAFSGYGTIGAIDVQGSVLSIRLLGASRLLRANIGSGAPVDFAIASTVQVMASHGMMLGSMGSGGMMGGMGNWRSTTAKVNSLQANDFIWFSGRKDATSGDLIVTRIMLWLN